MSEILDLSSDPVWLQSLEVRRFLQHITGFALEEQDRLRLDFNRDAGDDTEYMLSIQALRAAGEEGSRVRAPLWYCYGRRLAELYLASQGLNVRTVDMVQDQIDQAPLIAKLAFNECLIKTAHSARADYFRLSCEG